MPSWMHRLETIRPWHALLFGMVLICVSPADLAASFSALRTLIGSDLSGSEQAATLVVVLLAIDSSIIVPLLVYVLLLRLA